MLDANGTPHHALIGKDDFAAAIANPEFGWDDRYNELTLAKRAFLFPTSPFNRRPQPQDRRGAAADQYGNIYWVAESRTEIRVRNSGGGVAHHFWSLDDLRGSAAGCSDEFQPLSPAPPPAPTPFGGLAVTCAHFLVAGAPEWNGLLVFDLHHGGPPRFVPAPSGASISGSDIAAAPDGGVWILDAERRLLWRLDRNFDFLALDATASTVPPPASAFGPLLGASAAEPAVRPASPVALVADGAPMQAVSVEALPDGTVLLLETNAGRDASRIFTYRSGRLSSTGVVLAGIHALIEQSRRAGFRMRAHDMAVAVTTLPDGQWRARLFAAAPEGDQSFSFDIAFDQAGDLALTPITEYFPMRLFGGKAIFGSGAKVFYDSQEQWVSITEHRLVRYATEAVFETIEFDGKEPGCQWHRLILDAIIAPGAQVLVRSRAADAKAQLSTETYSTEPVPYQRRNGAEIPFHDPFPASTGSQCSTGSAGSWELLLQKARGRYLQLEITLKGDARVSPRIRAMRLYYPRFSYLDKYLPRVYREDKESSHFLDRFLANSEGVYTAIESRIAAMQVLMDPDTCPASLLVYLSSWLGVALEPSWDERKRRLFLRHASEFFTLRGTRRGVLAALRLALEDNPGDDVFLRPECGEARGIRISEHFTSRQSAGMAAAGRAAVGGDNILAVLRSERWTPQQGAAELHRRYAEATGQPNAVMPVTRPTDTAKAEAWETFARNTLGFVPSARAADTPHWPVFLRRRYSTIGELNAAWRTDFASFEAVPIAASVPDNVTALADWVDFHGIVLPGRGRAHRFTVFIPVTEQEAFQRPVQEARRDLARRIVALQKPAHTTFDVQFYWTFFRIGDVRLGVDTVLDLGSRSPFLMTPALLGNSFIGSSYLAPNYPQNLQHRTVLGRGHCAPGQGATQ